MARNQKNFRYFKYVDDNAFEWSLRGESGGAGTGVDGHANNDLADPVFGRQTSRRHPRYVIAQDPTTFRTIKFVVYTLTAFAAIVGGATIAVQVAGSLNVPLMTAWSPMSAPRSPCRPWARRSTPSGCWRC